MTIKNFFTIDEVSQMFGVSKNTIYKYVRSGVLPALQFSRRYFVPKKLVYKMFGGDK